jgi:hypothetical protein
MSVASGKLTIGEAGTYTYAKHVNGVPFHHWQGDNQGNGIPVNPTRQIFDAPPIYEFSAPIGGTYPVAYDPSYWHEGLKVNIDFGRQIRAIIANLLFYFELFGYQFGALTFGVLLLYATSHKKQSKPKEIISHWSLAVIALVVFAFYGMISVIGRYVGAFVLILWADLLAEVRLPSSSASQRLISAVSWLMISFLCLNVAAFSLSGYGDFAKGMTARQETGSMTQLPNWPGEVAETLWEHGVKPGDKVGVIGYGFDSYWARLAKVQIVAEMLGWQADPFWLGSQEFQEEVLQAIKTTGAKAIVAEHVPQYASLFDWHQVGDSNYYIFLFR